MKKTKRVPVTKEAQQSAQSTMDDAITLAMRSYGVCAIDVLTIVERLLADASGKVRGDLNRIRLTAEMLAVRGATNAIEQLDAYEHAWVKAANLRETQTRRKVRR